MINFSELRRKHYYNPVPHYADAVRFFALPRLCGYEMVYPADGYRIEGLKRGGSPRALFKYTLSGRGKLVIDNVSYSIEPGDLMLLTGPRDYIYEPHPESEKWEFIFISYHQETAVRIIQDIIDEIGNIVRLSSDSVVLKKAWSLYELFKSGDIPSPYAASRTGFDMLMEIGRESTGCTSNESDLVRKVSSYCFRNLARRISVCELAGHCGYSRFHFTKLFNNATGIAPSEYISDMKLDASLQILQHEDISIKELAARCGFDDQGYFTRKFKARFGVTPLKFNEIDWNEQNG